MTRNAKHANRYWGEQQLPPTKAEFFNAITTPAPAGNGTVATIRMYGPIDSWGGFWGISAKDVGAVLDALPDSVTQIILRVNSPGGEVFEGVSILNMLRAHKASVTAVVDGLAASAASVIAAGCTETVMSPGTQMMIHSPWTFTWGSAADLRKEADVLDNMETSLIEIYEGKAGAKDWPALLADETWLTAAAAVELGLADRVAVIPDAGESVTVADDDELVVVELGGDDEASALARTIPILRRASAQARTTPSSSEPGEPHRKEEAVAYSDLTAGLRKRLGVTDAEASDETLLAAVDEALAEQLEPTTSAALPDGTVAIDATVLAELQSNARLGADARAEQDRARRDGIIADALREGRITAASRDAWRAQLDENETGTTTLLNSLAKNTVPVTEIGHADAVNAADEQLYAAAGWGTKTEKGA